jgi:small subunit ribosomal protein S25e
MSKRGPREKIIGSVEIPDIKSNEVMGAIKGMKAITPTGVATKFNLKISVAKRMLKELEKKGIIRLVIRSKNLKVYEIVDSKTSR